jgi:hypothetical protein
MFWSFNLSFDILATVLATFPNNGRIFTQFSGHSGPRRSFIASAPVSHVLVDCCHVHVLQDEPQLDFFVERRDGQRVGIEIFQPFARRQNDRRQGPVVLKRVGADSNEIRRVRRVEGGQRGQARQGVAGYRLDKVVALGPMLSNLLRP